MQYPDNKPVQLKVILLGEPGVGKTSLFHRYETIGNCCIATSSCLCTREFLVGPNRLPLEVITVYDFLGFHSHCNPCTEAGMYVHRYACTDVSVVTNTVVRQCAHACKQMHTHCCTQVHIPLCCLDIYVNYAFDCSLWSYANMYVLQKPSFTLCNVHSFQNDWFHAVYYSSVNYFCLHWGLCNSQHVLPLLA